MYFCIVMLTKTRALVLRTVRFGDNKCIVSLLTEELGRVDICVAVSGSAKARFRLSLFQPLTILDVEIDYRTSRSLQSLRSALLSVPYTSLNTDLSKMCEILFLTEFLYNVTKDEQHNEPLFRYITSSLEWLDTKQDGTANFHLVFMMRLARFIGFLPNVDDYHEGCFFDLRNGSFVSCQPLHGDVIPPDDARRIVTLLRMNYDNMHRFAMSRQERNALLDVILKFYRIHVPNFPEMKSIDVLRSLYT